MPAAVENSASIFPERVPTSPVAPVWATGRWHRDTDSLRGAILFDRMRRGGCEILDNRGALDVEPFAAFKANYSLISEDRSEARCAARDSRRERLAELSPEERQERIDKRAAAEAARIQDIYDRILASIGKSEKLYTEAEGKKFLRHDDRDKRLRALAEALPSDLIRRYMQSSDDRINGNGYTWLGGIVTGDYWQDPFVATGLKSDEHWLLKRFPAAGARASSGDFRAGRHKYSCHPIWRKLVGLDEPYMFFGERCRDMWRVDIDRTFADVDDLRRWLRDLHASGALPFLPHVATWIRDDRRPGKVINPHLYFLLPEGSAVWNNTAHHRLLNQVIAALTEALGGDPGGLANPFHGKNPLSVHCDYEIVNDSDFPTLSEYASGLRLTHDTIRMARKLAREQMQSAGFDAAESNTYFSRVSAIANDAAKALYRAGFRIGDAAAFETSIEAVTVQSLADEISAPTASQREAVEKLARSCARWAAANFNPAKLDKPGRDVGAAAHLMNPDDDATTRRAKGGAYAAGRRAERNGAVITSTIRKALRAGGAEPTFRQIADATGYALNTVKKHWISAYTRAVASLSVQMIVKGVNPPLPPVRPPLKTLSMAVDERELPMAWRNPAINDRIRVNRLRRNRDLRRSGRTILTNEPIQPSVGANIIDFLSAGPVTIHRRSNVVSQAD